MPPPTPIAGNSMCQRCGTDVSYVTTQSAQRTTELEQQVRLLTDKATAAADKLADYEDELRHLKSTSQPAPSSEPTHTDPPSRPPSALQSRLSALLPSSSKRSLSQPPTSPTPFPTPPGAFPTQDPTDLLAALTHETALRHAAETRFSKAQEEMEELSTQLFAEANEMVAEERRERKRLEDERRGLEDERKGLQEKVEVLERRVGEREGRVEGLERRAREREGRWEELERRVRRGERVRGLLAEAGG